MTIHRLLQNIPLSPEDVGRLVTAYESTLEGLELTSRSDPITEIVARKIIEIRMLERKPDMPDARQIEEGMSDIPREAARLPRYGEARQSEFAVSRGGLNQESRHNKHNDQPARPQAAQTGRLGRGRPDAAPHFMPATAAWAAVPKNFRDAS